MVFEAVGATGAAEKLFARLRDDYAKVNPRLSQHAAMRLQSLAKRAALIGKPLEIKGELTNGHEFDLANVKGKAVLVDCWATWCGPCVKEIPNLKKTYEKYHKQGFDIVGISGDEDRQDLVTFLKEEKLPWGTIFGKDAFRILEKYDVQMFPTTMLVGPDRKVVGLNLRGGLLKDKLVGLLKAKPAGEKTPVSQEEKK